MLLWRIVYDRCLLKWKTRRKPSHLPRNVSEKDSELEEMRCEIEALEERVGKQEQFSSKDTVIIENLPIYDVNLPKFFERFLQHRLQIGDIGSLSLTPKN